MEELKSLIKNVEASKEFKDVKDKLSLCSFFSIMEKDKGNWQVDYYNAKKDEIVSFVLDGEKVKREESKIFKEKESKLDQLNLDSVKVDAKKAFEIADKLREEKYKDDSASKKIVILQTIKKPVWNITYLTGSLNVINIKINAVSGEIVAHNSSSALSLGAKK